MGGGGGGGGDCTHVDHNQFESPLPFLDVWLHRQTLLFLKNNNNRC